MNATAVPVVLVKCRICMGEFEEHTMTSLFEEQSEGEDRLGERVQICSGIRVRDSPKMPGTACSSCCEFVDMWFNFRQLCLNAQIYWATSCPDSERPAYLDQASDTEYMEYLYEKLQLNYADSTYHEEEDIVQEIEQGQLEEVCSQSPEGLDFSDLVMADQDEDEAEYITDSTDPIIMSQMDAYENEAQMEGYVEDNSQSVDDNSILNEDYYEVDFDEEDLNEDDFLSLTRDQTASPLAKRKPGRPRKPDSELKGKRKEKGVRGKLTKTENQECEQPTSFTCSLCGEVYDKKSLFSAHMMAHTDYKPNQCEICHKAFRQKGELRSHMRRHTGERPYKCAHCDRHFYDRSERIRHERVHTNTRPYACQECGKTFTHTAILKNHRLVHTGEKNYSCDICSKSFTLLHQLKAHLTTQTHRSRVELMNSTAHPEDCEDS
ncbi:hypothetical protein KR038_009395 [Drosophila bunnanda]|nr:hypothetical protein KR038_009395 [Drosophila bunnanda]